MMIDPAFSAVDSKAVPWRQSTIAAGVAVKDLGCSNGLTLQIVRFDAGARFPHHRHKEPEFIFVLSGSAVQNGVNLGAGWAGIAAAGTSEDDFHSPEGCTFLLIAES